MLLQPKVARTWKNAVLDNEILLLTTHLPSILHVLLALPPYPSFASSHSSLLILLSHGNKARFHPKDVILEGSMVTFICILHVLLSQPHTHNAAQLSCINAPASY